MPNSIFNADTEGRLLEIWGELLESLDKEMSTRAAKEAKATLQLNEYAKEIGLDRTFTVVQVSNKIDTLKKKGKSLYERFKRFTATGTELPFDMQGASQSWETFHVYHRVFKKHPTWGPGTSLDTAVLSETSTPQSPPGNAATGASETALSDEDSVAGQSMSTSGKRKFVPLGDDSSSSSDDSFGLEGDKRPKKKKKVTRTDRARQSLDGFVGCLTSLETGLQEKQHTFETQQAERHRAWMYKRDKERAEFEKRLQNDAEKHQMSMAEQMREHSQRLAHESMTFMAELFKRMDK